MTPAVVNSIDLVIMPSVFSVSYAVNPPLKFCIDTPATRIFMFKVSLSYDSQKLTIEPENFSTSMAGLALTTTIIQPGEIEVEGLTMMDAGSPLNADKYLFQINLPPKAVPAATVTLQGTVDSLMAMDSAASLATETASAVVKAIAKTKTEFVSYGDENLDGVININDTISKTRELNQYVKYPDGTVLPYSLGDNNLDGEVNILDALRIARYASIIPIPEKDSAFLSDVNFDGGLTIVDALLIARYSVGMIDSF